MKKRVISFLLVIVILCSYAPLAGAFSGRSLYCANSLYALGLMQGTGVNQDGTPSFELNRAPTRAEAVAMLIRLLGKEKEALYGTWSTPFYDVPDWAKPYVGYAYASGLTQGMGSNTFGSDYSVTASQYITFVLRALGYISGKDFEWDKSYLFSDSIGLTDGTYKDSSSFLRGDAAIVSYGALSQKLKNGSTLLGSLYANGAVSSGAVSDVGLSSLINAALTPTEIYAKCSPAVFYIVVYDWSGHALGQASGFFISSDGTAVTNYHVIEDAYSAKVKTLDGKIYNVLGVCSSDANNDLAIIKVDGTGFPYLELGDSKSVSVGSTVYAIGNPQGLEGSISQGIVSFYYREIDNTPFMQITAPISPGSSGGALLDSAGRVVGVTTGGITTGQSLNLAVPINYLRALSRDTYISFEKSIPNAGKEVGYAAVGSVPDFGAYFGKNLYDSRYYNNTFTYYYRKSPAMTNVLNEYFALLQKWGFAFKEDYTYGAVKGKYYTKDNITLIVAVIPDSSGDEYIAVQISLDTDSVYPKTEAGSDGFPSVPNFEIYFGLTKFSHDLTATGYINRYDVSEVNAVDTQAVSVYCSLLERWGFSFVNGSASQASVAYQYRKNDLVVTIEKKDGYITQTVSRSSAGQ